MSMHEFEDLVEASVHTLAHSQRHSRQELRALYWNLYNFEGWWDTGFTQRRVLDLLLAAHYTYRFDLPAHPDYRHYPAIFQSINQFSFLNVHPDQEYNREHNPTAGYCEPPYLYCDVNSQLWYRFVQLGVLIGEDTLPVERQDPIDVARVVVEDARAEQDFTLIAEWYLLLLPYALTFYALNFPDEGIDKLTSHPSLTRIKQLYYQTEAHNVRLNDYGFLVRLTSNQVAECDSAIISWWYDTSSYNA